MHRVPKLAVCVAMCLGSIGAQAYEKGDWILRAGLATVAPNSSSDDINLPTGLVAEADVDSNTQLGIIPAYMITDSLAIEVLAATPFEHDIKADGKGAIAGTSLDAGSTKHLPPTISLQWYPRAGQSGWQPYVGLGVNYTVFFDEDTDGELVGLLGDLTDGAVDGASLDLEASWGLAAQAGVDIPINDNWAVNLGVWYIDISTEAEVTATAGGAAAAVVEFDVDIDPWVYNIGVAYKF